MDAVGSDSDGREFKNAGEMWREEIGGEAENDKKREWYRKGVGYWEGVEASVDGVLGGYGHVNAADVKGSEAFLRDLLMERFGGGTRHLVALDCGSGIGRVTKNLLLRFFNEVDLVEPVSHFLEAARDNLAPENSMVSDTHKAINFYCVPLQDFTPEVGRYDVIWIQWCIGQLADDDFVAFFNRAKAMHWMDTTARLPTFWDMTHPSGGHQINGPIFIHERHGEAGLKPDGFFVLKENIAKEGFVLDKEDQSVTRSDLYFKELFKQCGLHIYKIKDQKGFPRELFAVKMYALVTDQPRRVHGARKKMRPNAPAVIKS